MKRILAILLVLCMLPGCASQGSELDRAMALRTKLLSKPVSFDARITADYGDSVHMFSLSCQADTQGNVTFTVTEPQSIRDITGTVSSGTGKLTFADKAIAFDLLADGQLSPLSAPWIFLKALRSGYMTSCGKEGEYLRLAVDDSYADDALHLDIWLGDGDVPLRAEILWQGSRVLSMDVGNFTFV